MAKRREEYVKPPETSTVEEVLAIARAGRSGSHRLAHAVSPAEIAEQQRLDVQDAALYIVAGFTGLRQGELLAQKWGQVRFKDRTLVLIAGMSAGIETTTKSGKWGGLPLARDASVALDELSQRECFTSATDYVFSTPTDDPLNPAALRRRY